MTRVVIDQWSPNCVDYTFLSGTFEHAPPKCLLIYLWTIYMYYWSARIFFLPTKNTVHPTSATTVIHERKKGTQMLLSGKDSFSSCWKKASFVPHLSTFSFVCYWQFLQIPNVAKIGNPAVPPTFFHFELFLRLPKPSVLETISEEPSHIQKCWGKRGSRKEKLFPPHFKQLLPGTSSCSCNYFTYLHQVPFPASCRWFRALLLIKNCKQKLQVLCLLMRQQSQKMLLGQILPQRAKMLPGFISSAILHSILDGIEADEPWTQTVQTATVPDYCHRIMELVRLEEISRIIRSSC